MCFQYNVNTYCNRQQNAASMSSSVLPFWICVQICKTFYDMSQERVIVSAAERILSLRHNAAYYPPFAFYVYLSLKTKENSKF